MRPCSARFVGLVFVLGVASCSRRPPARQNPDLDAGFTFTRPDDLGRIVTLAREPRRIVSLLPSHTETLFALGVGERIVARDSASDWPEVVRGLPSVGGMADVNVEAVAALAPDVVLCSEYGPQSAAVERAGLVAFGLSAQRYEEIFRVMRTLGALTNRNHEADALVAKIESEVASLEKQLAGSPQVRVYYEIDPTPYTVGPRSFVGVLLAKAHGDNVIPDGLGDFPKIAPEVIVAADPDVILGVSLDEARKRPGWAGLKAVRAGRVSAFAGAERDVVTRPGPRVAEALRIVARKLHPGAVP